jgi:UPF0755 protein
LPPAPPRAAPRRIPPGEVSSGMPVNPRGVRLPPRRPAPVPVDEHPTEVIPLEDMPDDLHDGYADEDQFADDYEDEYDDDFYEEEGQLDALVGDGDYDDEYDDEERAEAVDGESPPRRRPPRKNRKRSRAIGWVAALAVIALLVGGAWYGVKSIFGYDDFDGPGDGNVIVQVADGDSTSAIGATLVNDGVVASTKAFVKAAEDNSAVTKLQHGYYQLKKNMSGAEAVSLMTEPTAHVGQLEIRAYQQFDDVVQPDGKHTPGLFTLISQASCAQPGDPSTCISTDALRKAVTGADLTALGAPQWAIATAAKAPRPDLKLEGLIAPGVYDVKPGWSALDTLGYLVKNSAQELETDGLNAQSGIEGHTPYETLVVASIIEREAVQADFGKISRVIYNRLDQKMKLQMDSTVNYLLDKPVITTKPEDRAKPGPYNTYANQGLTPTPISAPSAAAIKAALAPAPGDWLFFVKCETSGLSCFAVTDTEHEKNVKDAQARGIF